MNKSFQDFFRGYERYFSHLSTQLSALNIREFSELEKLANDYHEIHRICAEFAAMSIQYRKIIIPQTLKFVTSLKKEYNSSTLKQDYPDLDNIGTFNKSFENITIETLANGYSFINHKIESIIDYTKNHSKSMSKYNINYIETLKKEFNLSIDSLKGSDEEGIITPRIDRIRLISNRYKHDNGYPKSNNDTIISYFKNFAEITIEPHKHKIPLTIEEFLIDLNYADDYINLIIKLINSLRLYCLIKFELKKPVTLSNEHILQYFREVQVPAYILEIEYFVQSILKRKLDLKLAKDDILLHPSMQT